MAGRERGPGSVRDRSRPPARRRCRAGASRGRPEWNRCAGTNKQKVINIFFIAPVLKDVFILYF